MNHIGIANPLKDVLRRFIQRSSYQLKQLSYGTWRLRISALSVELLFYY